MEEYWHFVGSFYKNSVFSASVLLAPLVIWVAFVTLITIWVANRLRFRPGKAASTSFIVSFSLVGSVTGAIAGATLESIVGAALAAILGLVSSLLAYLFSRENLRAWRLVIPFAMIALLSSTLVGLIFGSARRGQVLAENDAIDQAKLNFQQLYIPLERERGLLLIRKCIEEKNYNEAAKNCKMPPASE